MTIYKNPIRVSVRGCEQKRGGGGGRTGDSCVDDNERWRKCSGEVHATPLYKRPFSICRVRRENI